MSLLDNLFWRRSLERGRGALWRVEVYFLGIRVSDDTGLVTNYEDGPENVPRAVTRTQQLWVYGVPALAGVLMAVVALKVARSLVRLSKEQRDLLGEQLPQPENAERDVGADPRLDGRWLWL